MTSRARSWGLVLGGWVVAGCGPEPGEPSGSGSSGSAGSTAAEEGTGTDPGASSAVDGGSEGSSGAGATALPCAWVEGHVDGQIPQQPTPADVACDPATSIATIRLAYDGLSCGDALGGDWLVIELPPELQAAGEYDLTALVARIRMAADVSDVSGQVDTGTLLITQVTPTEIVGWAHGGLEGYDFEGSFTASHCP